MPRAADANGEVRVEKVDRIRFVYNAVTKPSVHLNPGAATMTCRKLAADFTVSRDKIDYYIARKKKQFAQEA